MTEDIHMPPPDPRTIEVVLRLAKGFPAVKQILDSDLKKTRGEILPHMVMQHVADHVSRLYDDRAEQSARTELEAILQLLERAFEDGSDDFGADRELITVSFLEHLPDSLHEKAGLRDLLGPALREELEVANP